ncbi:hypothetical protein, partial [Nostoc sp.]
MRFSSTVGDRSYTIITADYIPDLDQNLILLTLYPTFRTSKCNTLMFQRILLIAANYLSINTE